MIKITTRKRVACNKCIAFEEGMKKDGLVTAGYEAVCFGTVNPKEDCLFWSLDDE